MLLDRFHTIRLKKRLSYHAITVEELCGFNVGKENRQDLKTMEALYATPAYSDSVSECDFDSDKRRSEIFTELDEKKYHHYSRSELERLADQVLDPMRYDALDQHRHTNGRTIYNRAAETQHEYDFILALASLLVNVQQTYLLTRNWMDKKKLTYLQVANQLEQYSEATIRRRIKALKFNFDGWKFSAKSLLCANELPYICKLISTIQDCHPNAGRSTIYRLLNDEGYDFSDGNIGKAIRLLQDAKQREFYKNTIGASF